MRKNEDLSKYSLEELKDKANKTSKITYLLLGVLVVLLGVTMYDTLKQGEMNIALVTPVALFPIVAVNMRGIKRIKEEISKRERS